MSRHSIIQLSCASFLCAMHDFLPLKCSVQDFKGQLLMSVGYKLEMHAWNGVQLLKTAFYDAPLFITSVSVVKDYILLSDVHRGCQFVRYVVSFMSFMSACGFCLDRLIDGFHTTEI